MRFNVSSKMIAMIISKKFGEKVVKNSENVFDSTLCVFIFSFYLQLRMNILSYDITKLYFWI